MTQIRAARPRTERAGGGVVTVIARLARRGYILGAVLAIILPVLAKIGGL